MAAVLAGGDAALLAEDMGQVALVVEAAAGRDFGEGKVGRVQHPPRLVQPDSRDVVRRRRAEDIAEFAAEHRDRHVGDLGEARQGEVAGAVLRDKRHDLAHLAVAAGVRSGLARETVGVERADGPSAGVLQRIQVGDHEVLRTVCGPAGDAAADRLLRGQGRAVERHVGVGVDGREEVGRTLADGVDLASDVADLAVSPVEGHDAAIGVLDVDADVADGLQDVRENRRVRPEPREERIPKPFSLSDVHATDYTPSRRAVSMPPVLRFYKTAVDLYNDKRP